MRLPEFARSTTFRWAVAIAGAFALCTMLLFGFVYWRAANYLTTNLDEALSRELDDLASLPPDKLVHAIAESVAKDPRRIRLTGLFAADGRVLAGNIERPPTDSRGDSGTHEARVVRVDERGREEEVGRIASRQLESGDILVTGRNIDDLHEIGEILTRTLGIGLVPAFCFAILAGVLLSARANRRIDEVSQRARRIVAGGLRERLPVRNVGDPFDKLAGIVNGMLDDIERLIHEIAGVGDDIAHDLRTPLSRVRATLERGRENARTVEEFHAVADRAIAGVDQSLAMITALLRIAEIEHGRRLAGFGEVALADLMGEIVDLYAPMAEDHQIELGIVTQEGAASVRGDRDLLFEAIANLVDNAVKFTPAGGSIALGLARRGRETIVRVSDTGPGIGEAEREAVLKRFYRSDKSRHAPGVGLGLSLVAAIVKLHGFRLTIVSGPGCTIEIACPDKAAATG